MKKHLVFLLTIFSLSFQISLANIPDIHGSVVIGTVNGENLLLSDYNRLIIAQRKSFRKNLDFDLFSKKSENLEKREDQLKKAKNEGLSVTHEEFSTAWEKVLSENNGLANLETKGKENKLLLVDIQRKLEDNLLLDKYFDKHIKEKLLQVMVDELIILQEAKARNLQVPEELIVQKLELIQEKQGGEESFGKFLSENNATIEDARLEVKNQFLYEFVREEIVKELRTSNKEKIKNYFSKKRENSSVIVYDEKIPGPKITLAKLINENKVKPKEQDKKEPNLIVTTVKVPEMVDVEETKASKASSDVSRYVTKEIDEIEILEKQIVEINKNLEKKKELTSKALEQNNLVPVIAENKEPESSVDVSAKQEAEEKKQANLAFAKKFDQEIKEKKQAEAAFAKKLEQEIKEKGEAAIALARKQEQEAKKIKQDEIAFIKQVEREEKEKKKTELVLAKKQEREMKTINMKNEEKRIVASFDKLDKKYEEKRLKALKKKIDKYALVKAKERKKKTEQIVIEQVVPGQPIVIEKPLEPNAEQTFDISKELQELRKKIEERRVSTK